MEFWRISNYADLSGVGGIRTSGRWHTRGRHVVYLADHPASALLEILVRVDPDLIPDTYHLLRVSIPDELPTSRVRLDTFPSNWREQLPMTREIGDRWLAEQATAILQVPSAIVPAARNVLLNPGHHAAGVVTVTEMIDANFDKRLIKVSAMTSDHSRF